MYLIVNNEIENYDLRINISIKNINSNIAIMKYVILPFSGSLNAATLA